MDKRSRKIMFFAVLAAVIVAVPILFYTIMGSDADTGIAVTSSNTVTNVTFAVNFSKYTDTSIYFNPNYENNSSITYVDQSGSNRSTLKMISTAFEFADPINGYYAFEINFTVIGNFSSHIMPGGLTLAIIGSNYTKNNSYFNEVRSGGIPKEDNNATGPGFISIYYAPYGAFTNITHVKLFRENSNASSFRYHFAFQEYVDVNICPYSIHPTPFNVSIQAALSGYSSNVFDQMNFHVVDVGQS